MPASSVIKNSTNENFRARIVRKIRKIGVCVRLDLPGIISPENALFTEILMIL